MLKSDVVLALAWKKRQQRRRPRPPHFAFHIIYLSESVLRRRWKTYKCRHTRTHLVIPVGKVSFGGNWTFSCPIRPRHDASAADAPTSPPFFPRSHRPSSASVERSLAASRRPLPVTTSLLLVRFDLLTHPPPNTPTLRHLPASPWRVSLTSIKFRCLHHPPSPPRGGRAGQVRRWTRWLTRRRCTEEVAALVIDNG